MKAFLYILIGLVVVLAAVVLIAPSLIDWNTHKDRIAEKIRKETGRAFTIEGDMSLALLPVPALSASRVCLANIEGGSPEPTVTLPSGAGYELMRTWRHSGPSGFDGFVYQRVN